MPPEVRADWYVPEPSEKAHASRRVPQPLEEIDFGAKTALVFGSEGHGISAAMLDSCDGAFTVPLPGLSESLNVSVAVAVCCHFGRHQRQQALALGQGNGDLDTEELNRL